MSSSSFSQAASSYDQDFTFTAIGEAQRACVWQTLLKRSVANKKILELNFDSSDSERKFIQISRLPSPATTPSSRALVRKNREHRTFPDPT